MPNRLLTPIPLHRVAMAMPFIHYPHQRGAEVECELKRANLPGYTDPSHFARVFRRLAGASPREYLQKIQE
jgi:hypothetical protein